MGDPQLAADVAGPHSLLRELYNPLSHNVGQRAAVDEDPAELVDSGLAWGPRAHTDRHRLVQAGLMC